MMISSPSNTGKAIAKSSPALRYEYSSSPKGMVFPDIPLDAFNLCLLKAKVVYEVGYAGFSFVFG